MLTDSVLLDRYARTRDEAAFAELVRRYIDLVYSSAARRIGDRHLAEDVTQAVFMILARKARAAARALPLSAWLLMTVRYAAANAIRIERRRQHHHAAASAQASDASAASPNPPDVLVWREVAEHLDDAVLKLPSRDRQAVLLRYFQDKPISDIANVMGTSEGAVKQRLSRSLEKLRQRLNRRGVALALEGASGLAALLATHAIRAAPARLISAASSAGALGAAGTAASLAISTGAIAMMTFTQVKTIAAILLIASALSAAVILTTQLGAQAQNQPAPAAAAAPASPQVRQYLAARVQAAQDVVAAIEVRVRANEPLTPTFVELQALAQRRLVDAQIDATDDATARSRLAEQHVQQCRDTLALLRNRMSAGADVSNVQVAQSAYHLADAEYVLAKLKDAR